jgi:nucleotide-binding universal stress UspA family protein
MRRRARALQVPEPVVLPAAAVGSPHVEIIRRSRVVGADLTVMGRHGQRALMQLVLGTTASRVVRLGDTPVLVVNQEPAGPYRRPLVGVDLEDASAALLLLALRVLPAQAGAVTLVHACQGSAWGRLIEAAATRRERAEGWRIERRVAAVRLRALLSELDGRVDGRALRAVVLRGDPRRLLLQQAARLGGDLLVLGTHGRAGLSHVLLGSVAERVLAAARCDVLVARPSRFTFQLP